MQTVTVDIYGEQYAVKTDDEPEYVEQVAQYVDRKMKEIANTGKVVTTSKIAILAALNIADEFLKAQAARQESDNETGRRIERLLLQLQGAVGD
jgi:cell division protein ZapA